MDRQPNSSDARDRGVPELVEGCLRGDDAAARALVSRFQNSLLKEFLTLDCRREDAEDLVQESFMQAFDHLTDYRPELGRFRSWLFGIGYRLYRDRRRRARRRERRHERYSEWKSRFRDDYLAHRAEDADEFDPLAEVWDILTRFPERDRLLVHLRYMENLTIEEVGDILQLRPAATRMRIHRVLRKIRRRLESRRRQETGS
jgi:RNA polymerase sigma-70 factor (ECF subfamily)